MRKLVLCLLKRRFAGEKKVLCSQECPFLDKGIKYWKCTLFNRKLFLNYSTHYKSWSRCDKCLTYREEVNA